jgi:hypothetical protein
MKIKDINGIEYEINKKDRISNRGNYYEVVTQIPHIILDKNLVFNLLANDNLVTIHGGKNRGMKKLHKEID